MNISILGCGWLGWPLGKHLVEDKHYVKGSTTTNYKLQKLREQKITPYLMKVFAEGVRGDLTAFLSKADLLILNIPPGLRKNPKANFTGKIERLIPYLQDSAVKKVLFVSSTSVYRDKEDIPVYTEKDEPNGTSKAAKQLIGAENNLLQNQHFKTTVLRFAGLLGEGRHPLNFLTNKTGIKNPKAPVNLIHQEDCIKIIQQIIEKESWGEIFNAAYPEHPEKESFYRAAAKKNNLAVPKFDHSQATKGKIINSEKLKKVLDFEFKNKI